jgi:hypothetical protein
MKRAMLKTRPLRSSQYSNRVAMFSMILGSRVLWYTGWIPEVS